MEKRFQYITDDDVATAKVNGICKSTLVNRVRTYGWDIERAITQPVQKRAPLQ